MDDTICPGIFAIIRNWRPCRFVGIRQNRIRPKSTTGHSSESVVLRVELVAGGDGEYKGQGSSANLKEKGRTTKGKRKSSCRFPKSSSPPQRFDHFLSSEIPACVKLVLRSQFHCLGYDAHGPRPHNKSTNIQKGVYDFAVRCALSTKFSQDQLTIVDSLSYDSDVNGPLLERLAKLDLENKGIYFLYGSTDDVAMKAFITAADSVNIPKSDNPFAPQVEKKLYVASARNISIMPIMENEHLVIDKAAVEYLEKMYHTD